MSRVSDAIAKAYPHATTPSYVPTEELSDSQRMANLASHVVELFESNRINEIRPAFDLAEQLILTGTDAEQHAAIIGFLETVQNVASHRQFGMSVFEQFLGPSSKSNWAELIDQWTGKKTLAEIVAAERGTTLQPRWWQFWKKRSRLTPKEMLDTVENPELKRIIEQITRE